MKQWVKPVKYLMYEPEEFQIFGIDPKNIRDSKNLCFNLVKANNGRKRIWFIQRTYEKDISPSTYLEEVCGSTFILYWNNHYVKVMYKRNEALDELLLYEFNNEVI